VKTIRSRRAAIDEIYTEDCVFYDPARESIVGDEIDASGRDQSTHLNSDISQLRAAESGNGGLVRWVSGRRVRRQLTPGRFHHRPGRPDCRVYLFSTSYLSWTLRATSYA